MHNHHHHHVGGSGGSAIHQLLSQLGQSLQSGNLTAAQQAYSTLLQEFQQSNGLSQASSPFSSNSISVTA
jgi:hypothetical protein